MAGINYEKTAERYETKYRKKGDVKDLKKAADFYFGGKNLIRAYTLYEELLSKTENNMILGNIRKRLKAQMLKGQPIPLNLRNFVKTKGKGLERKFGLAMISMASLLSALFFTSVSLTGYSVKGLTEESFRLGGVVLFVLGLVFAFFYFKGKK